MAYELQKQAVVDRTEFEDFALGTKLTMRRGNKGYFEQNFTTSEQARDNLVNLLSTRKGERLMHPDFGSGLHTLLFEQIIPGEFENKVLNEIESTIERWLPYISVESIDVDMSYLNMNMNKVDVTVLFKIGRQPSTETVTFTITD